MFFLDKENILVFYKNGLGFTGGTRVISRSSSLSCLLCSLSSSIDVLVSKKTTFYLTKNYTKLVKAIIADILFMWLVIDCRIIVVEFSISCSTGNCICCHMFSYGNHSNT